MNSLERSPRATGGTRDCMVSVLGWLRARESLTERIEQVPSVDADMGARMIQPKKVVRRQRRADGTTLPDVVLSVSVFAGGARRVNLKTRKDHTGQVVLSMREGAADDLPGQWPYDIADELTAVLTTNHAGWLASSVPGGDQGLIWNERTNRGELATTFDMSYRG